MSVPSAPRVDYLYRGFLLRPPTNETLSLISEIDYQVRTSTDNSYFGNWQNLVTVFPSTNFAYVHDGLFSNVYYEYRLKIRYTTAPDSDWSDYAVPGNGSQIAESASQIDQRAASLGIIQGGFIRGAVFETSANYPKVRMDPLGFFAITATATPIVIPVDTATPVTFGGKVNAVGLDLAAGADPNPSFINRVRWLAPNKYYTTSDIFGYYDGSNLSSLQLSSYATPFDGSYPATAYFSAQRSAGLYSQISCISNPTAGQSKVEATVAGGGLARVILNDSSQSDFIQVAGIPGNKKVLLAWGRVDIITGGVATISSQSGGITAVRTGIGACTLSTMPTATTAWLGMCVTQGAGGNTVAHTVVGGTNGFTVSIQNATGGALTDDVFHFFALGI